MTKTKTSALFVLALLTLCIGCKYLPSNSNNAITAPAGSASPTPTPIPGLPYNGNVAKKAYRISGNIDEALQEGNVCDTSVKFTVPGTLKFEFSPESPTKGTYTYSGPFNASGSGPYEIKADGSMIVDGTGCIMGKCATYSHKWKAEPIDPATCKEGK